MIRAAHLGKSGKRGKRGTSIAILALGAGLVAVCGPGRAVAQIDLAEGIAARANELVIAMEYDKARADLAKADPNSPSVVMAKARLALYEEDCDLAAALMSRNDVAQSEEGRVLADVARGCARVTAATLVDKDEAAGVIVRWHDEADRALMPMMVDTVNKARVALTRDLGVEWKAPTRITVVRDLLSLSAMTGLPYKAAQTTGTVAVAKWGRVTILSPRASKHGYPWRDTLTHELTHLAISMQSRERAPLWLHEGVARRQEVRWREPGPFDDRPSVESVVQRGMELKLDLPLDKLGPSIAMLPSADAAMVAFAEVTSFVRFFVETQPEGALAKLLVALRAAKSVDEALVQVSGEALPQWDTKWRAPRAKAEGAALAALRPRRHAPERGGLPRASPPGRAPVRERTSGRGAHPARQDLGDAPRRPQPSLREGPRPRGEGGAPGGGRAGRRPEGLDRRLRTVLGLERPARPGSGRPPRGRARGCRGSSARSLHDRGSLRGNGGGARPWRHARWSETGLGWASVRRCADARRARSG